MFFLDQNAHPLSVFFITDYHPHCHQIKKMCCFIAFFIIQSSSYSFVFHISVCTESLSFSPPLDMEVHFQTNTFGDKVPLPVGAAMTMPTLLLQSQCMVSASLTPLSSTERGQQGDSQGTLPHLAGPPLVLGGLLSVPTQLLLVLLLIPPHGCRVLALSLSLGGNTGAKMHCQVIPR